MNFYKRHLGDYAKDAGHLSMLEHGAYTLLLDRYYTTEKPIPCLADAYRICRARTPAERAAVDDVLREFFVTDGEAFLNRRAEEEIAKASHQRTVNREIGKRGGRPKQTESVTEHKTDSVPIRNPSQTPDSKEISEPTVPHPKPDGSGLLRFPPGFDSFWQAYPRKVGKDAAAKAFAKRRPDAALLAAMLAAVERQKASADWRRDGGQYIPHPSTWLNEGRWMDEAPADAASAIDPELAALFRRGAA